MGRNLEGVQHKSEKGQINQIRPKSEKFQGEKPVKRAQTSSTNLIKKNLDEYVFSLSNFEFKRKLESCPGKFGECPLLTGFREGLKKSISNHLNLAPKNDSRLCKTSRNYTSASENIRENVRMSDSQSNSSSGRKGAVKEIKSTNSSTSRGVIRSTRAQDLRSQSNRDLLRPKTVIEKVRTASPYLPATPHKKKKCCANGKAATKTSSKSNVSKTSEDKKIQSKQAGGYQKSPKSSKVAAKKGKPESGMENTISLQRQRTQEIINPKIIKKANSNLSGIAAVESGDCEPPQLKKSQTFFICKGAKKGEGDDKSPKEEAESAPLNSSPEPVSDGNPSDENIHSPKPKPLTHNDSFCLIAKSSQQWSQKNRSDDEKWLQYDLAHEEKSKKQNAAADKGILKNGKNHNLKSVDSLEKVDSEKIVRFSDEMTRNKKVLKKFVRRKKRLQNFFAPTWYQKNKLFQKYLQILREKSVLLSESVDVDDDLKLFRIPIRVKERYEAEMFGLYQPRRGKSFRNLTKDSYSY